MDSQSPDELAVRKTLAAAVAAERPTTLRRARLPWAARREAGKALRSFTPRASLAHWSPPADRVSRRPAEAG